MVSQNLVAGLLLSSDENLTTVDTTVCARYEHRQRQPLTGIQLNNSHFTTPYRKSLGFAFCGSSAKDFSSWPHLVAFGRACQVVQIMASDNKEVR